MILLDANILLYAHIEELPQYKRVAQWLENLLSRQVEATAISWIGATAFLRIATSKRIFKKPWSVTEAAERLDALLEHPMVEVVGPTERHWSIFSTILADINMSGDVVMDAHVAAIAVEHNASVASAGKDFRRFADYVKIIDPLKSQ